MQPVKTTRQWAISQASTKLLWRPSLHKPRSSPCGANATAPQPLDNPQYKCIQQGEGPRSMFGLVLAFPHLLPSQIIKCNPSAVSYVFSLFAHCVASNVGRKQVTKHITHTHSFYFYAYWVPQLAQRA